MTDNATVSRQALDEQSLRRPEFTEGRKVTLGDGQEWVFPQPHAILYPVFGPDRKISLGFGYSYGYEYRGLRR